MAAATDSKILLSRTKMKKKKKKQQQTRKQEKKKKRILRKYQASNYQRELQLVWLQFHNREYLGKNVGVGD
jgi:ribonuclease HI